MRLVIRCVTVTSFADADMLTSISFCSELTGSTGARAIKPVAVGVICTGTLSGAQVAMGSSGCLPDPITASQLKFFFPAFSDLLGKFLEQILSTYEAEANDSGTDIAGHDKFDLSVADAVAICPTFISCLFHFDLGAKVYYSHKVTKINIAVRSICLSLPWHDTCRALD